MFMRALKGRPLRYVQGCNSSINRHGVIVSSFSSQGNDSNRGNEQGRSYYTYTLHFGLSTFAALSILSTLKYVNGRESALIPTVTCDEGSEDIKAILKALQKIEKSISINTSNNKTGSIDVILGSQWGDEGKVHAHL